MNRKQETGDRRQNDSPAEAQRRGGEIRTCRACGCTETDCRHCILRTGEPCHWVAEDLCSACADGLMVQVLGRRPGHASARIGKREWVVDTKTSLRDAMLQLAGKVAADIQADSVMLIQQPNGSVDLQLMFGHANAL